jgi:hypothetical protein
MLEVENNASPLWVESGNSTDAIWNTTAHPIAAGGESVAVPVTECPEKIAFDVDQRQGNFTLPILLNSGCKYGSRFDIAGGCNG